MTTSKNSKRRTNTIATRRKKAKVKRRYFKFIGIILAIVLLFVFLILYVNKHDGDNKIASGISICSFDVSNMTRKQALKSLNKHFKEVKNIPMSLKVDDNSTDFTLDELGFEKPKNLKKLVNKAFHYGKDGLLISRFFELLNIKGTDFKTKYTLSDAKLNAVFKTKLPKFKGCAVNASIEMVDGKPVPRKGKNGLVIDRKTTKKGLLDILNNDFDYKPHSVKVSSIMGEPDIKKSDLKDVKNLLGTFRTDYIAGTDSAVNIESGTRHIDGTIVMPGEEISANALMEPYTYEEGYGMANSYADGKVVSTMGGGVCQVSTTLYNAVILSELKVTRRAAHSMPIAYVPLGRDAAISDTSKDLCFVNSTDAPIYISAFAENGVVSFTIYGKEYRDVNRDISFDYEVAGMTSTEYEAKLKAEEEERKNNPDAPKEKEHSIDVVLYKFTYVNGNLTSKEHFNDSTYLIKPQKEE